MTGHVPPASGEYVPGAVARTGGSQPERPVGPAVARLIIGARLHELRQAARVTQAQAASALRCGQSKISRIEGGEVPIKARDITALLRRYKVTDRGAHEELLTLADRSNQPGSWASLADTLPAGPPRSLTYESEAVQIMTYDSHAIPPLLQTPAYAAALCHRNRSDGTWRGGQSAQLLAKRQDGVWAPERPRIWALIHEAVLRRVPGGDRDVLLEQLDFLIAAMEQPRIKIQIVPEESTIALHLAGPFSLLRFGPQEVGDMVLVETLTQIDLVTRRKDVGQYLLLIGMLSTEACKPDLTTPLIRELTELVRTVPLDTAGALDARVRAETRRPE